MALDGRVNQRHNSRELAHHLQRRGEDVGMAQLDDVQPQKGRTPTPYEEFENPEFKDLSDEQTARILRAAETIVGNCERRVEELAREHNIKVELGVPAESWSPPADVREELENRAARNVPIGNQAREPVEEPDRAEGAADRSSPYHKVGDGTPGDGTPTPMTKGVGKTTQRSRRRACWVPGPPLCRLHPIPGAGTYRRRPGAPGIHARVAPYPQAGPDDRRSQLRPA